MLKKYLGITVAKKPREKGKRATRINNLKVTSISMMNFLNQREYSDILFEGFNKWLLETYKHYKKIGN